jgi:RNA polymerase sigma-70 factor, ECF subfamily
MDDIERGMLNGIKAGDQKAFGYVVRLYFNTLLLYARSIVYDTETAREIVQDVFMKIWTSREVLAISSSLQSYLYRMVHNLCLDHIRKKQQKFKLSIVNYHDDFHMMEEVFSVEDSCNFFDHYLTEQSEQLLRKGIEELPGQCRDIFILCRYRCLSYQEVAEQLGVSLSTVKTQMARAMTKLRELMKEL